MNNFYKVRGKQIIKQFLDINIKREGYSKYQDARINLHNFIRKYGGGLESIKYDLGQTFTGLLNLKRDNFMIYSVEPNFYTQIGNDCRFNHSLSYYNKDIKQIQVFPFIIFEKYTILSQNFVNSEYSKDKDSMFRYKLRNVKVDFQFFYETFVEYIGINIDVLNMITGLCFLFDDRNKFKQFDESFQNEHSNFLIDHPCLSGDGNNILDFDKQIEVFEIVLGNLDKQISFFMGTTNKEGFVSQKSFTGNQILEKEIRRAFK